LTDPDLHRDAFDAPSRATNAMFSPPGRQLSSAGRMSSVCRTQLASGVSTLDESIIEVRTSMQGNFEVRTSISCFSFEIVGEVYADSGVDM